MPIPPTLRRSFIYLRHRILPHDTFTFSFLRNVTYASAKLFCLYHVFSEYVGSSFITYGSSMLPTLAVQGDSVWVDSRYRLGRNLKVGDLVSFKHPIVPSALAIKRVMGMPGDFVVRDTIDGDASQSEIMLQVPEGHCWVLGDNLTESRDSRVYGPLPLGLVKGKVIAKNMYRPSFQWLGNGLARPEADT